MKKILITGKNSYVGTSLKKWLSKYPKSYLIDMISLKDNSWREENFSKYDVIYHVAGIAHIKETKENAQLYYKINRDLAYETAKKAKKEGVKQFIFLSSMSVFGIENGIIDEDTVLNPKSNYGKSKLQAEKLITSLHDDKFNVAILRPPMIYGKGCKGNYKKLANFVVKIPFFPKIENIRSMIFIDNLSEFVRYVIDNNCSGIYCPQNKEYVNTSKMVELIAKYNGKKIWLTKIFNPLIVIFSKNETINKIFGDLVYEKSFSEIEGINYIPLEDSIRLTER